MARIADPARPAALLDRIADRVVAGGLAGMSLRPLARAVGSSPRVLLYYFGSKEAMLLKVLARIRERQRATYAKMKSANFATPADACRAIWRHMSSPQYERLFRMSVEAYSMALRNPRRFATFLRSGVEDWLGFLAEPLIRKGHSQDEARAHATVILAGFRGFMLDYCASHDRARLDRAVELWLGSLDHIPLAPPANHLESEEHHAH
ncbi:MAG TPA: TetR/AcrR family transcriptional regulator [Terriglobales bacterium]|nr:TetR/AcrR family transcriptional regulator [Terriglobales bacterium]